MVEQVTLFEVTADNFDDIRSYLAARIGKEWPASNSTQEAFISIPPLIIGGQESVRLLSQWINHHLLESTRDRMYSEVLRAGRGEGSTIDLPISDKPQGLKKGSRRDKGSVKKVLEVTFTFELLDSIGRGSMGEVYRARMHSNFQGSEIVALKVLNSKMPGYPSDDSALENLPENREIAILSELNGHPNIVSFKGANIIPSESGKKATVFFVMEYVSGFDLNGFKELHNLSADGLLSGNPAKIPSEMVGFILFKIANALDYANNLQLSDGSRGIVHLDISPGNILINQSLGLIKLSDFGVAARMGEILASDQPWSFVGKPKYVSPEIVNEQKVTFAADLYSLGAIMYELLTGLSPNRFEETGERITRRNFKDLLRAIYERELIPPHEIARGVDERLSEIAVTLMEYDPADRFNSALKLRETIGQSIYQSGYGPTDGSLAQYVRELLLCKHQLGNGKGMDDPVARDYVNTLIANREPCQLFKTARKRLSAGENPCRV